MKIRFSILFLIITQLSVLGQDKLPFQVLVAKDASIYGEPVKNLQMVDDVTSIEVKKGGFVSLVHKNGTTFEHEQKIFTFYLKPEEGRKLHIRPKLDILHMDSMVLDPTKVITAIYPPFDPSGYVEWNENEPFELYWHLYDEPVVNYVLAVKTNDGTKIQDFRTRLHKYTLKPETYGLKDDIFNFKITSTFAGETVESKTYTVALKSGKTYPKKATDLVLKALFLELSPDLALPVWQEALAMANGNFYKPLFQKFLIRNQDILVKAGKDVQLLLSQNK